MPAMRRLTPVLAWLASAVILGAAPVHPLLVAINKGDHTLAIVDATTLEVLGKAPTGPDPHEVVASADGRLAFITNYTEGNQYASSLSVVDLDRRAALPPIDLGALARPHGLWLAGGKVYFTAEGSKVVGRMDPASRTVDWVLGTGQSGTHMVIVSKDEQHLFTSNIASGTVCLIDRVTRSGPGGRQVTDWTVTSVPVGRGAEGFDLSPDGRELWVANAADATVSIVDVASKAVVQTLQVPFGRANRLKFTPDGRRVLVSDLGGHDLIVLDAAARKEAKRIDVGGGAAGTEVDPDGSRAFVSVGPRNGVAVIDLKSLTVSGFIETGPGPDGLAWVTRHGESSR
jgi:YVTN family beta-propeller protein